MYIAGGAVPAALFRNESPVGGALRFTRLAADATDLARVVGAYPIDIDGDGILDLAVLRLGENVLLRGTGGCRFERANERWHYDGGDAWTAAFSATWESQDGLPTLAFGNYLKPATVKSKTYVCDDSQLVRPASGGGRHRRRSRRLATARGPAAAAAGVRGGLRRRQPAPGPARRR